MKTTILMAAIALLLASCTKRLHKEGSGVLQTTTRHLQAFDEVLADGDFKIYTHHSSEHYVIITTDNNIMSDVQTFVQDGRLYVEMNDNYLNYDATEMALHVYASTYENFNLDGRVELQVADTIHTSTLLVDLNGKGIAHVLFSGTDLVMKLNGTGEMSAAGNANTCTYDVSGDGKINGLELNSTDGETSIKGLGKIYVNCTGQLHATIDGSGHIYYLGSPAITSTVHGSGSVEQY